MNTLHRALLGGFQRSRGGADKIFALATLAFLVLAPDKLALAREVDNGVSAAPITAQDRGGGGLALESVPAGKNDMQIDLTDSAIGFSGATVGPFFDICIQDDKNPNLFMGINSITGEYEFVDCGTGFTLSGEGELKIKEKKGCVKIELKDKPDSGEDEDKGKGKGRRKDKEKSNKNEVKVKINLCKNKAEAKIKLKDPNLKFKIKDKNIADSFCGCL